MRHAEREDAAGGRTMTDLDLIDRKIVAELMQAATLPIAQIAAKAGLSQTPAWKRIQKLEASGVITGRVALADPAKLVFGLTVFVGIEAPDHSPDWREAFGKAVEGIPEIMEVTGWPESSAPFCASPCRTWQRSTGFTNALPRRCRSRT